MRLLAKETFSDLVTFTEEILNGKLHFLCSDMAEKLNLLAVKIKSSPKLSAMN